MNKMIVSLLVLICLASCGEPQVATPASLKFPPIKPYVRVFGDEGPLVKAIVYISRPGQDPEEEPWVYMVGGKNEPTECLGNLSILVGAGKFKQVPNFLEREYPNVIWDTENPALVDGNSVTYLGQQCPSKPDKILVRVREGSSVSHVACRFGLGTKDCCYNRYPVYEVFDLPKEMFSEEKVREFIDSDPSPYAKYSGYRWEIEKSSLDGEFKCSGVMIE